MALRGQPIPPLPRVAEVGTRLRDTDAWRWELGGVRSEEGAPPICPLSSPLPGVSKLQAILGGHSVFALAHKSALQITWGIVRLHCDALPPLRE